MSTKKRGLGRGLDALLSSASSAGDTEEESGGVREIALEHLAAGRHQPRRHFDEEALRELAASISAQGVVQPIVVRPVGGDRYEIVAGERRWRAAKLAGLSAIPVVVRSLDERGAMAVALVENIQRADLNPLEESQALHRLIQDCGLTHEETAKAVGRSRAAVSNLLRLAELDETVQQEVRDGRLSLGHAKVLLGVERARQVELAHRVIERQLSVRALEALIQQSPARPGPRSAKPAPGALEGELSQRIGLPVTLKQNKRGRGRLTIAFRNAGELQKLLSAWD